MPRAMKAVDGANLSDASAASPRGSWAWTVRGTWRRSGTADGRARRPEGAPSHRRRHRRGERAALHLIWVVPTSCRFSCSRIDGGAEDFRGRRRLGSDVPNDLPDACDAPFSDEPRTSRGRVRRRRPPDVPGASRRCCSSSPQARRRREAVALVGVHDWRLCRRSPGKLDAKSVKKLFGNASKLSRCRGTWIAGPRGRSRPARTSSTATAP